MYKYDIIKIKIITIWIVYFCIIFLKLGGMVFMIDIDTSIIIESFWKGFSLVFETIKPFMYSFLIGAIIVYCIKLIGSKLIDFVYIGYSKREIKRKKKEFNDTVDFISAVSDILSKDKNRE